MIKLVNAHIEEMRGIRKLDIDFKKSNFVISGPNGSGKSGVIDSIEFGLTGEIGRLTGRGTRGLTLSEHGPHVDKTKFPDAAFVQLKVFIKTLGKSVTITRKVSAPKKPKIEPSDPVIVAALAEMAEHPEVTLSRREILRFILTEPTKRSEEIQTILKLDEIGQTRSALNTAQNRLQSALKVAATQIVTARASLQQHLQIATLKSNDVMKSVNERRNILNLQPLTELTPDTKLDSGLAEATKAQDFNKLSAFRDLKAFSEALHKFPDAIKMNSASILAELRQLESDPALFSALQRRSFIEKGLSLVDGVECPLCDQTWTDEAALRSHLQAKLAKSEQARKLQESLLSNATSISTQIVKAVGSSVPVQKVADGQAAKELLAVLKSWKNDLEAVRPQLETIDGVINLKERFTEGRLDPSSALAKGLKDFADKIEALPDQSVTIDTQTFLSMAQLRLGDYREAMRKSKTAEISFKAAKIAYDVYCTVLEEELNKLYDEVQKDFSDFYKEINQEDEATFTAKLTPTEGSLALDVNFYDRGLFPPAAYHSEGHQDGMGVCLYLSLMKRLFGDQFTFALLDDVVMSVDSGHRYQFCKLLKKHFPNTQFIITTHDRLWAEQMRSAGLVTSKTSLAFHSWTIDSGPLMESNEEIWDEIAAALAKGKVEAAAAGLRHHLEYASRHLAEELGATMQFRADGNYELGDLLPSVLARMDALLGKATAAAQSWGNTEAKEALAAQKNALKQSRAAQNVEQWAVNKAVHYNEWANFGKKDFEPVVKAFKDLMDHFRCSKCDSWLYAAPRFSPETLRCLCNDVSFNLNAKSRAAG